jgi:DNA-binding beta-propeller fold protein YncE
MHILNRLLFGVAVAGLVLATLAWAPVAEAKPVKNPEITDKSDLNRDGILDILDLQVFSSKYLELNYETVDWCDFYTSVAIEQTFAGRPTDYYRKNFRMLLGFIYDEFSCNGGPLLLGIKNDPASLTRGAIDSAYTGNYFFSDARVGSVFIYDPFRVLIGELKNLDKPLGVAIDSQGYLLVGNSGRDNIEVYDPANGDLLATFGEDLVRMPTTISIGPNGDIYVTDSKSHQVWVFESNYVHVRTIGEPGNSDGQLKFPTDTAILTRDTVDGLVEEVYVLDQGNKRIQVFDTHGNFVRTIDPPTALSNWCTKYGFGCPDDVRGTFNKLQALDVDAAGRLHVLDVFEAAVSILDPVTGQILESYGGWGDASGQLRIPLDVLLSDGGEAIVTDNDSAEMEVFTIP